MANIIALMALLLTSCLYCC